MANRIHCSHCGDVIGVYEPMIVVVEGKPRETSRAAEEVPRESSALYHRDCFVELTDDMTS